MRHLTHPPTAVTGWRFQATSDSDTLVFDVVRDRDGWTLLDVYV
ncbi:hypothetical protein ACX3O0_06730 [Homoserinimonas sp. A447]